MKVLRSTITGPAPSPPKEGSVASAEASAGTDMGHTGGRISALDEWSRRLLDVIGAGAGLVLLSPLMLLVGFAVKLQDGGPALYRATRVGKNGRPFTLYKFRTMVVGADRLGAGITASKDVRVTTLGSKLRRTKLDELPQLINVFLGDMSLVGPRPEDPRYVALYTLQQREVLRVRPGLTGPASLAYRAEEQALTGPDWEATYCTQVMQAKLDIDLRYLARRSILTDMTIILRTVASVLVPDNRPHE